MPNGRCYLHGGKSPKGVAAGQFKDGRYSKYMPTRLLERYTAAEQDTELLNMRAEVALVDARLADLLSRADTGEAGTLWEKARKSTDKAFRSFEADDMGGLHLGLMELDRLIGSGLADHEVWYEIQTLLEQRRRLVESEQKRLISMQQMVTAEQATALITAVLDSVKRNVTDRAVLMAIQTDMSLFLGAPK